MEEGRGGGKREGRGGKGGLFSQGMGRRERSGSTGVLEV